MPEVYILLVDDMPKNLFALEKVLNTLDDVIAIKASSGQEALGLTLQYNFALAILDVQMPEMDGMTTLKKIREDAWGAQVPIIILTNLSPTKEQSSTIGTDLTAIDSLTHYLIKSDWKLHDVVKEIEKILGK